ncbi:MAG: hypothetical protein L6R35_004866 [Caloplaca aegaea]|nr:MAG: hypothetical protein L6R35_004866 [Caloplaca aegaea]
MAFGKKADMAPADKEIEAAVDELDSTPRTPQYEMAYSAPLHRKLKSRHIQMIAIGGIIGPGLFVGSGNALHLAGPAGILISFSLVGIIVFFVMQSLGEVATLIPVSGSFTEYASRFVDDSVSFALGWAYWYLWVTVLANEYNAISLVVRYWAGAQVVPQWAWILIFWVIFISFSMLGILAFGEVEFWLSFAGVIGPQKIGFKYWNNPGAFADSINGVARTFVIAGTLYAGTEMVGITAGEASNPRRAVPRAIKQVFWRILIFYVGTVFFIGILIPWDDGDLLAEGSRTARSPFTIALSDAGINAGASLINAVIVIAVLSAGNSSLYISSRTMLFMARNNKAPKFFSKVNKAGVPWVSLLFSNLIACIAFLAVSDSAGTVYEALITLSGVATFIVWATIGVMHIRFRQGLVAQNQSPETLPFKALWYPYGTYVAVAANVFLIFFQGYTAFLNPFSAKDFVVNYILLPVFVALVVGYKFWRKTKIVKLAEMDIWTGRRDIDRMDKQRDEETGPEVIKKKGMLKRARDVIIG